MMSYDPSKKLRLPSPIDIDQALKAREKMDSSPPRLPRYLLVMATETISLLVLSRHGSTAELAGLGLGHLG